MTGTGGRNIGTDPQVEEYRRLALREGWDVTITKKLHLKWVSPPDSDGVRSTYVTALVFKDKNRIKKIPKFLAAHGVQMNVRAKPKAPLYQLDREDWRETLDNLPPAVAEPCGECPFLRRSTPGHVGPISAQMWARLCHTEAPIACHLTVTDQEEGWEQDGIRQCEGAAIFRANIHKSPRHERVAVAEADRESVFSWDNEMIGHHSKGERA